MKLKENGVSICCMTYNHANFIRETLENILMQKMNFPFEIIIHDDASNDGTAEILLEYQKNYPNIIRLFLESENQFSKGIRILPALLLPKVRGKYVAICDGDDQWTYDCKLQEQYDFLEKHLDVSFCFHNALKNNLSTGEKSEQIQNLQSGYVDDEELIMGAHGSVPTTSCFFRSKYIDEIPKFNFQAPVGDDPLRYYYACRGKIYYFNEIWAIRNFMHKESWNYKMQDQDFQTNYIKKYMIFLDNFDFYSKQKYNYYIELRKQGLCSRWFELLLPKMFLKKDLEKAMLFCQEETEHRMDALFLNEFKNLLAQCEDYVDEKAEKFIEKSKEKQGKLFLYGTGQIANCYAKKLELCGFGYEGFVVSDGHKTLKSFYDHPVWELSELSLPQNQVYFMLCLNEDNTRQVLPKVKKMGFQHIFSLGQ